MTRISLRRLPLPDGAGPGAPLRRLEFHIVYRCVNACVFCSEKEHMRRFADHPASGAEISALLRRKRAEGFEHVTFTGGEPTLYPRVWDALALARDLGYRTFLISNGSALSLPRVAARVLPLVDELCLSVHGHTAALHDRLTARPGSFGRLVSALENAAAHAPRLFVMANTVVNRLNLRFLPEIMRLLARHRAPRHYLVSHLAPEGDGLARYRELAVRHQDIVARLPELASIARRSRLALRVFGVPACAMGRWWRFSNDLYFSPRVTVGRVLRGGRAGWFEEKGLRPTRERRFLPACAPCVLRGRCGGVFRRYLAEFGPEGVEAFQ
ncbi:MAG: radical SAM protein [Elusimicrobia bacterium]|nr:radical SAM protein [Elusimicrobiota bacterium]